MTSPEPTWRVSRAHLDELISLCNAEGYLVETVTDYGEEPLLPLLLDQRDARRLLAEREAALVEADALFKSLGQIGHILDEVLEVMCKGREICGGVRITMTGPTSFTVENPARENEP